MATATGPGSSAVLRQLNSSSVLEVLMRSTPSLRVAELASATGLSRPTVETVVDGLLEQGWAAEDLDGSRDRRQVGRPARRFTFNAQAGYLLGVDVGAHTIAASLADLNGTRLATIRRPTAGTVGPGERMTAVNEAVAEVLLLRQVPSSAVMAATVGTPGTVSPTRHRVGVSPALAGWADTDITADLRSILACDVELENDANLAVVGEQAAGVARDAKDVVFLLLGERLGAGVLVGGSVVRGHDGAAGEIGYVPVPGLRHAPAGFGPLESRVNASALVDLGRKALEKTPGGRLLGLCDGDPMTLTAENITLAAAEGDPTAIGVLGSLTRVLVAGLAPVLLILNPEVLVIGGGISRAGPVIADVLTPQLKPLLLYPPEVRVSALGSEAVLVGALHQAMTRMQKDLLTRVLA